MASATRLVGWTVAGALVSGGVSLITAWVIAGEDHRAVLGVICVVVASALLWPLSAMRQERCWHRHHRRCHRCHEVVWPNQ
jgi:hypothetical protein